MVEKILSVFGLLAAAVCALCMGWDAYHIFQFQPQQTFTAFFIYATRSEFWGVLYLPLGFIGGVIVMTESHRHRPKRN